MKHQHIIGFAVTFGALIGLHFITLALVQRLGQELITVELLILGSFLTLIIGGLFSRKYRSYSQGALAGWLVILLPLIYVFATVLLTGDLM